MVFRRDNKVDSFQRQMSALRQQLGNDEAPPEQQSEFDQDFPDLQDDQYRDPVAYDQSSQGGSQPDNGGYSFGNFPARSEVPDGWDEQPGHPAIPEMPSVDSQISVIANDTFWKGDLESDHSLHVYGKVEGTLKAENDVWIAEGADVSATVQARRVVVAGSVSGSITATDRFEALPQGDVTADVHAPTFVIHEGATINGTLKMGANGNSSESRTERSTPSIIQRRNRAGA